MSATTSNDAADDELCDIMSLPSSIEDDDDDIDDVSTTSTVIDYFRSEGQSESGNPDDMDLDYEDPERLWDIEAVAAERRNRAGKMRYLVHWVGFPIHRSTWEVAENFPDHGLDNWEETKAEIAAGLKEPFKKEISRWRDAVTMQNEKRLKRNAKRKRLGLPFKTLYDYEQPFRTDWEMDLDEPDDDDSVTEKRSQTARKAGEIFVCSSSSDEAEEDNAVDDAGSPRHLPETRQSQQRANRIFKETVDSSTPTSSNNRANSTNASTGNQQQKRVNLGGKSMASSTTTNQSTPSPQPTSTLPKPQAVTAKPSATGYQGTARRHTDQPRERPSATGYQGTAQRATADVGAGHKPVKSNMLASTVLKSSKGMSARRTVSRPTTMTSVTKINISALRKPKRKSYLDSEVDGAASNNSNKRYVSLSTRRRVELRTRNKENDAPTAAEMEGRLFDPALGPPASKPSVAKPPPIKQTLASRNMPSMADSTGQTTKAKRKSVHFATFTGSQVFTEPEEMDVVEDATNMNLGYSSEMEIDSPEPTGQDNADSASPVTPVRKVSFAEYQAAKTAPRSVQIKASFGSSSPLDVFFNDIPNDSDPRVQNQQWLKEFLSGDVLRFRHQCLAEVLLKRLEQIRPSRKNHCSGSITGKDDQTEKMLTNVSERLKAGGNGLLLSRIHYALLVYPAQCDHWASDSLDSEEKQTDMAVLRYVLFTPADDLSLMLQGEGTTPIAAEPTIGNSRVCFMDHLFGLGKSAFDKLVPPTPPGGTGNPRFYLIFPLSCAAENFQVSMWIRACKPDAEVYTAHPGSWRDFLNNLEPTSVAAVIVHEAAVRTLRRLPKLRLFLENARYWVWRWPDRANLWNSLDAQPERLFPFGHITLLTPSFVVSEPRLALETVSEHVRNTQKAIMVSHGFVNWVGALATEKSRIRQAIMKDSRLSDKERENKATMRGVSMDDCQATAQLANEILEILGPMLDRLPEESYTSNFIFADQCIDDNDEQSLVNWFGWWSIANAEKFRKFNVLGTRNGSRIWCRKRAFLKIPSFAKDTTNDPDGVLRKIREKENMKEADSVVGTGPKPLGQPAEDAGSASPSVQRDPAPDLTVFRSERVPQEGPKAFVDELNRIQSHPDRKFKPGVWRMFVFPIFWKDGDELFKHGRMTSSADNMIRQWFDYTWPFDKVYKVYIGFCYTVEDCFNPTTSARGQRVPRRPWLVVYRIKYAEVTEQSSNTPTEIIIVDPVASMDTPGKYVLEDCLPSAQQAVINHIRKHEGDKKHRDKVNGTFVFTHRMPPQKVAKIWVAGMPQNLAGLPPVDQCLRLLESLLDNLDVLPLSSDRLARMGFKSVFKEHPPSAPSTSSTNDDNLDGNPDASVELDTKIVFHPPVPDASFEGTTKCSNRLFEAAQSARAKDKKATHMTYEYRPTVEWYEEQRLEGRGWEHVWVGTYEKLYSARQKTKTST